MGAPKIEIKGNKADGLILVIAGDTRLGPDEISIFPMKDGCHILANLSEDLKLLGL